MGWVFAWPGGAGWAIVNVSHYEPKRRMTVLEQLEPTIVWQHFSTLCAIPRASKQEQAVRLRLVDWAYRRGLEIEVDGVGNLVIRKPASPGREERAGIILQAHLDMVCQANNGTAHDFTKDPIRPVEQDGWLVAEETTLGADNGIGVALALAALEDSTAIHPPLEVLLTVDEESGMSGAHGLPTGVLQGRRMLNLDTEEWGEFYLGCAGGCDVTIARHWERQPVPEGYQACRIAVTGLKGGHSGCDIHLGRGNANKILVRLLRGLERLGDIRLVSLTGGTARNALPREAWAVVAVPADLMAPVDQRVSEYQDLLRAELAGVDDAVAVSCMAAEAGAVMATVDQQAILAALNAAPHGVKRMSAAFEGVVETSNNLGVVSLGDGDFTANLMVRSLRDSAVDSLAEEIVGLFSLAGCQVSVSGQYPGWTPDPHSPLLALCRDVYRREWEADAKTQVIHAGLECGIIGAKYPGLDTVSFGPTIRGAHAPGERVEIGTVQQAWHLLRAILAAA